MRTWCPPLPLSSPCWRAGEWVGLLAAHRCHAGRHHDITTCAPFHALADFWEESLGAITDGSAARRGSPLLLIMPGVTLGAICGWTGCSRHALLSMPFAPLATPHTLCNFLVDTVPHEVIVNFGPPFAQFLVGLFTFWSSYITALYIP